MIHDMSSAAKPPFAAGSSRIYAHSLSGWLILDKPLEMSSAQLVARVKRLTGAKKVGHGGTLDPLATGVLPIALNEATKTFQWLVSKEKAYRFTVRWGQQTSTDDREGEVIAESPDRPVKAAIEAVLPQFTGVIQQAPPAFSAIKQNGKRAYAQARAGEVVELPPRPVEIFSLALESMPDADHAVFALRCGKGTYVRALARDLGSVLGCGAHVAALRRTAVDKFDEKSAITLAKLTEIVEEGGLHSQLLPMADALDDIPGVSITEQQAMQLRNGQRIMALPMPGLADGQPVRLLLDGRLQAVAQAQGGKWVPQRVFNVA